MVSGVCVVASQNAVQPNRALVDEVGRFCGGSPVDVFRGVVGHLADVGRVFVS